MGYLDPGLFGLLSQAGLAVLLVFVSIFTFFFKPIKKAFRKVFPAKKSGDPAAQDDEPRAG